MKQETIMANSKRLDEESKIRIQERLGYRPSAISKEIGFSLAIVYRELNRESTIKNAGAPECQALAKATSPRSMPIPSNL